MYQAPSRDVASPKDRRELPAAPQRGEPRLRNKLQHFRRLPTARLGELHPSGLDVDVRS